MSEIAKYNCPVCLKGNITIEKERTGPPGFRDTDYNITKKTCECINYNCDTVAIAIIDSQDKSKLKSQYCERCNNNQAVVHYGVKSWVGEYIDICTDCFKLEMNELKLKNEKLFK